MYSYKDGRVWIQLKKFEAYKLLLPYGLTNVTDPAGSLTAVREPSSEHRRQTVVKDILRGEPGLPEFQVETRLNRTLNYMLGLGKRIVNVQCHMGDCDRPDNFYASSTGLLWDRARRGDLAIDRVALIEGDDSPDAISVPFSAERGPALLDYDVAFLSARTISHGQDVRGFAFLGEELFQDCQTQEDAGENGYVVFSAASAADAAVFYTDDFGDTWSSASAEPFDNDEDISDVVVIGRKTDHRIIVSRGTADSSHPAEIAYADVTTLGTVSWVTVDVGSVNGQYINKLYMRDYMHVYAITNDGYIYRSSNGGASWSLIDSSAGVALYNVAACVGDYDGMLVVVGANNTMLRSMDWGDTWTVETAPSTGNVLKALTITPDGTIYVGDDAGNLYGSYDFAVSWHSLELQGITATSVNGVAHYGDSIIWVIANTSGGGKVLRSVDGGASFRLWSLAVPANGGLDALEVIDANVVVVGGDNSSLYNDAVITRTTTNIIGL